MALQIKSKIQVFQVAQAIATVPAKRNFTVVTDTEFRTVRGFYIIRNTGADYLRVGIKDEAGNSVQEPANIENLQVSTSVKIQDRFYKEVPFQAEGKKIVISVENFLNLTAADSFDLLVLLDNENL